MHITTLVIPRAVFMDIASSRNVLFSSPLQAFEILSSFPECFKNDIHGELWCRSVRFAFVVSEWWHWPFNIESFEQNDGVNISFLFLSLVRHLPLNVLTRRYFLATISNFSNADKRFPSEFNQLEMIVALWLFSIEFIIDWKSSIGLGRHQSRGRRRCFENV